MKPIKLLIILSLLFSQHALAKWIPFTLKNNHIIIKMKVNGQSVDAILDSGAEMNMIDANFIKKHGKGIKKIGTITVIGINSKARKNLYGHVPVNLFNTEFMLNRVVEGNLFGSSLLLGASFFKGIVVQIDYPHSKLRLLPRRAVDMKKAANVPSKRQRSSRLPAVKVKINDKPFWVTLDTGNNGSLFLKRTFAIENHLLENKNKKSTGITMGLHDLVRSENYIVNNFNIGPYELENVQVAIPEAGKNSRVGRRKSEVELGSRMQKGVQTKGILGYDILKNFIITIDYTAYKVHIMAP